MRAATSELPTAGPATRWRRWYAAPRLEQEAIALQDAEVDTVSGASYTSDGYRRSLQAALDTARATAGVTGQ